MIKRLVLGDIHGRGDIAINIYNKELPNEVVLLGDYFDSHDGITSKEQRNSFDNILTLRKTHIGKNEGKFIMLLGNHDYHYLMNDVKIRYSSWNINTYNLAHNILNECVNNDIITIIFPDTKNRTIYSHAGVSNFWLDNVCEGHTLYDVNSTDMNLNDLRFNLYAGWDNTGDTVSQSPIWIRPMSLISDMFSDDNGKWTQIVGHTPTIKPIENGHVWGDISNNNDNPLYIIEGLRYYIVEELDDNGIVTKREIKRYE